MAINEDEQLIWEGSPSQWTNFTTYLVCVLLCWLVVPIFYAIWKWIELRCFRYEITNRRIRLHRGVLSRRIDSIELYRIKDATFVQSFLMRLVGIGDVALATSDTETPSLVVHGVANAEQLREKIIRATDQLRDVKGVREIDMTEHNLR
jgi:uncharacterized membrane protein YdbT with pleckstrin-like domain